VTSPTFTLYNIHRGARTLVHLDAYRLKSPDQVEDLLLEDFLVAPYCLAIEWPERIAGWLPPGTLTLKLTIESPGRHRVQLVR
jgi:tRNA threonylcarbamoyladenosine biosynthesis protein TsaE